MKEKKQYVNEIKKAMDAGDFESANYLCDQLNQDYCEYAMGWWIKLLASFNVKNNQGLIDGGKDIKSAYPYQQACLYADDMERERFVQIANSIVSSSDGQDIKKYMVRCIKNIGVVISENKAKRAGKREEINASAKIMGKSAKSLFAKNFFVFLIKSFIILLPFITLWVVFAEMEKALLSKILLGAGALIYAVYLVRSVIKSKKLKNKAKKAFDDYDRVEKEIYLLKKEYSALVRKKKKLIAIAKSRDVKSSDPKKVSLIKAKFVQIYNE